MSVKAAAAGTDWDELSDADIECLDAVWDRFGHMHWRELVDWTHDPKNVPEWEDPEGSSYLIPVRRILVSLAVENAKEHGTVVEDHRKIDRLFLSLRR